VPHGSALVTKL